MRITLNIINTYKRQAKNNINNYCSFPKTTDSFEKSQINFQGVRCAESRFMIRDIEYMHCPACGLLMLTKAQVKAFVSDVCGRKGPDLAAALEKYEDESVFVKDEKKNQRKSIYRPQKQEIVNIIKKLAIENPSLSLVQLVQLKADEYLQSLIKEQLIIVGELEQYIQQELKDEEYKNAKTIINEYTSQIKGENEVEFRRRAFISALENVTNDTQKQQKITEIVSKLPTSDTRIDSFFVKYSKKGRTSKEIASKFVAQSIPTAEHLIPKSKGGKNMTTNYICDCADCNSARSNTDFDKWIEEKPQLKTNLQFYLEDVQRAIDAGELSSDYDLYIEEIIEVIKDLSNGKIKLQVPKSTTDVQYKATMQKRRIEVDKIKQKISKLFLRKRDLKKEVAKLEGHENYLSIVQYQIMQNNIKSTQDEISTIERRLTDISEEKQELKTKIEIAEKQHTEDELIEEAQEELKDLNRRESSLNIRLIETRQRLSELNEKRRMLSEILPSIEEIESSIGENLKIAEIEAIITQQIEALEKSVTDERYILDRLIDIEIENKELNQENEQIIARLGSIPQDKTNYEKYIKSIHIEKVNNLTVAVIDNMEDKYKNDVAANILAKWCGNP